ncbi:MAG: sugar transferase [Cytophagaceae bacterium]
MYRNFVKPGMDYFIAAVALLLLFPAFILLTIMLFFLQKGNVFFIQKRPGYKGEAFKLIKFCTMRAASLEDKGDVDRITPIGHFMRKYSLDELPQLINVLRGDISLVGPRPLLMEYLDLYNSRQFQRHNVKPGITGLAQVSGRNRLSWEEKFNYDLEYIDNLTLWMDIKILFLTLFRIFNAGDVNAGNGHTMEKFKGNK